MDPPLANGVATAPYMLAADGGGAAAAAAAWAGGTKAGSEGPQERSFTLPYSQASTFIPITLG